MNDVFLIIYVVLLLYYFCIQQIFADDKKQNIIPSLVVGQNISLILDWKQ